MLEQTRRSTIAFLLTAILLSGCSYATSSGRQQMAYARYVKKYSHKRIKQQTKFKKLKMPKMPLTPPAQPIMTNSSNDGPQSVSATRGN